MSEVRASIALGDRCGSLHCVQATRLRSRLGAGCVSRGYLSHLELSRWDPPLSRVRQLARALHVTFAELVQ